MHRGRLAQAVGAASQVARTLDAPAGFGPAAFWQMAPLPALSQPEQSCLAHRMSQPD